MKRFFVWATMFLSMFLIGNVRAGQDESSAVEKLLREQERVQELAGVRARASCLAMRGKWENGVCKFSMNPEKVCALLKGRWTGTKCEFVGTCLTVKP